MDAATSSWPEHSGHQFQHPAAIGGPDKPGHDGVAAAAGAAGMAAVIDFFPRQSYKGGNLAHARIRSMPSFQASVFAARIVRHRRDRGQCLLNRINSHNTAFGTMVRWQPWNRRPTRSGKDPPGNKRSKRGGFVATRHTGRRPGIHGFARNSTASGLIFRPKAVDGGPAPAMTRRGRCAAPMKRLFPGRRLEQFQAD